MPRRSRNDSRNRRTSVRERILATVDELFYGRGTRNVGIDQIIAESGVAKASLYQHFASKDALVLEFLRQRHTAWREWFERAVADRAEQPRARLLAVFDVLEEWFGDPNFRGCPFINTTVEVANPAHPAHQISADVKRQFRTSLRQLAAAAGLEDPDGLAAQLALLVEGAIVTALMEQSPAAAGEARAAAARLIAAH
ncbi:MAG TPA: TetR/AcrR family transcriptional regulator [Longimicrobiales bacterium]|nr:TetR/AcrR family transcriptional regulator [Longimicrobiales bacterium]